MSTTRKIYIARLVGRCLIFAACTLLCIYRPAAFAVLDGWNFFKTFSPLHLLWIFYTIIPQLPDRIQQRKIGRRQAVP